MFVKIIQNLAVPSGSTEGGEVIDTSAWNKSYIQFAALDGIAGTGSFAITSISDFDAQGGQTDKPYDQSFIYIASASCAENNISTLSIPSIVAKWGRFTFEATSGSTPSTTGSVLTALAFSDRG